MGTGKVIFIAFVVSLITATGVHLGIRAWETGSPFARTVSVPPVAGIDVAQARSIVESQGLSLIITRTAEDRNVASGHVISQSPVQGSEVKSTTPVAVVVSKGPAKVEVPPLAGLTLQQAVAALDKSGLRQGSVERRPDPKVPAEQVVSSTPAARAEATRGDSVDLVLSAGKGAVAVPDVVGKSVRAAKEALEAAKLKPGKTRYGYNDNRPPGIVLRQSPEAAKEAAPGSAVDLVVNGN